MKTIKVGQFLAINLYEDLGSWANTVNFGGNAFDSANFNLEDAENAIENKEPFKASSIIK